MSSISSESTNASAPSEEGIFEVDFVVDIRGEDIGNTEYRIRWKTYGPESDTWEPEGNLLGGCRELVEQFLKKRKEAQEAEQRALAAAQAAEAEQNARAQQHDEDDRESHVTTATSSRRRRTSRKMTAAAQLRSAKPPEETEKPKEEENPDSPVNESTQDKAELLDPPHSENANAEEATASKSFSIYVQIGQLLKKSFFRGVTNRS